MPYSNEDFILTGDDVTGDILRSPTTVYIGDGSVEGFTFVKVCTKKSLELRQSGSTCFHKNGNVFLSGAKQWDYDKKLCPQHFKNAR